MFSSTTHLLANSALIYMLACVFYLLITRNYGTPLKDSFTDAQRTIKMHSSKRRYKAFMCALIIATGVIVVARPLGH